MEIIQKAAQHNKTVENTSGDKDTWTDVMRRCAVGLSGVLEGQQHENEAATEFEVRMAKECPELIKHTNPPIQKPN